MSDPDVLRLVVQIKRSDPLDGDLRATDGTQIAFVGWTGLAAGITRYLSQWESSLQSPERTGSADTIGPEPTPSER